MIEECKGRVLGERAREASTLMVVHTHNAKSLFFGAKEVNHVLLRSLWQATTAEKGPPQVECREGDTGGGKLNFSVIYLHSDISEKRGCCITSSPT